MRYLLGAQAAVAARARWLLLDRLLRNWATALRLDVSVSVMVVASSGGNVSHYVHVRRFVS